MPRKKGFKHSEETKKKIGDRLVGHKHSEETIKKIKVFSKKDISPGIMAYLNPKKLKKRLVKQIRKKE